MSETRIILIRHGQSIGNFTRHFLGHTDLDLTETGYEQARITADYLKNEKIDVVYSSDLIRAVNTVTPIAKMRGLEIIKSRNLREIFAGDWENTHIQKLCDEFSKDYDVWKNNIGYAVCTNGESFIELQKRVLSEVTKIAEENLGKTVCIGTHATPIRALSAAWSGKSKDTVKDIPWATNASITRAVYSNGKFELLSYGEDEFLAEAKTVMFKNI